MSFKLKVHDGTARADEPSLCLSCRKATIVRGERIDDRIIECGDLHSGGGGSRVRFRVTTCNAYRNAAHVSLAAMEETAWILRSNNKRQIGFVPARDLKPADRQRRLAEEYDDY